MKEVVLFVGMTCILFSCAYHKVPKEELNPASLNTDPRPLDFTLDIKPIFEQHCNVCHSASSKDPNTPGYAFFDNPAELQTYALKTSTVNKNFTVMQARLRDIESPAMPLGKSPLPDSLLKKIDAWISLGAPVQ